MVIRFSVHVTKKECLIKKVTEPKKFHKTYAKKKFAQLFFTFQYNSKHLPPVLNYTLPWMLT